MTIAEFRCPHGVGPSDGRFVGTWNAPFDRCLCCGTEYPYVDMASWSSGGKSEGRTWTRGQCPQCGGRYREWGSGRPVAKVVIAERCDVILRIVGGWDIETTAECILPADHDGDHEPGDPA